MPHPPQGMSGLTQSSQGRHSPRCRQATAAKSCQPTVCSVPRLAAIIDAQMAHVMSTAIRGAKAAARAVWRGNVLRAGCSCNPCAWCARQVARRPYLFKAAPAITGTSTTCRAESQSGGAGKSAVGGTAAVQHRQTHLQGGHQQACAAAQGAVTPPQGGAVIACCAQAGSPAALTGTMAPTCRRWALSAPCAEQRTQQPGARAGQLLAATRTDRHPQAGPAQGGRTSRRVRAGVAMTAAKVEAVVMHTDRGTSASARKETTLLATPPGQLATRQILHASPCWPGRPVPRWRTTLAV